MFNLSKYLTKVLYGLNFYLHKMPKRLAFSIKIEIKECKTFSYEKQNIQEVLRFIKFKAPRLDIPNVF